MQGSREVVSQSEGLLGREPAEMKAASIVSRAESEASGRPLPMAAALVGLMALALAACASGLGSSAARSGAAIPDAAAGPDRSGASASEAPAETAALPPAAPPTLARLKGLTAAELKTALGEPTLLRHDGAAQLWQYAGSGCVLHVFLYEDHGTFRVTYAEVRIDDPDLPKPPTCVEWKGRPQAHAPLPLRPAEADGRPT
jgi:hypothetical protein